MQPHQGSTRTRDIGSGFSDLMLRVVSNVASYQIYQRKYRFGKATTNYSMKQIITFLYKMAKAVVLVRLSVAFMQPFNNSNVNTPTCHIFCI